MDPIFGQKPGSELGVDSMRFMFLCVNFKAYLTLTKVTHEAFFLILMTFTESTSYYYLGQYRPFTT